MSVRLLLHLVLVALAGAACGPTIQAGREDARISVAVRTALVNDPELGPEPIEITVRGGRVSLTGRVSEPERRDRAEATVRRVDGVRAVENLLEIGPREVVGRDRPGRLPSIANAEQEGPLRIIGLGAGGTYAVGGDDVGNGWGAGPIIRLRPRHGWGPSIGFSWTRTPLEPSVEGSPALATLAVRPVMGGIEWGRVRGRVATSVSLVGGYAFNSLSVDTAQPGPDRAISVANGFAGRAGVSLWVDVSRRVGLNVFGGYRWTRPTVTFGSDDAIRQQRINADAVLISAGFAYWVF